MASKTASMALRLGARTAQRSAARAAVLPAKGASMGLRNFTSDPRNVAGLRKKSAVSIASQCLQRRYISERPDGRGAIYEFEDVLSVIENPSDARLLIDVREPHEYGTNSIPTAINLPVTSHPDALLLSPDEFQDQFGFAKPPIGKEMIFFCKAGVRSKAAASIARQAGYTNVGEYPGSWNDWQKKGGPGTRSPPEAGGLGERVNGVSETSFSEGKSSGELHEPDGVVKPPKGGMFGTQ
ncbi:hypothetical protein E8E12_011784 [Didymella heteroderae]|uniref:Rhodanese domain-containing protein n=1 Tax=Didymella heteroderae TaxID=1769908 RepID=A0A9P4X0T4_9PLEO|nr:hypothetical protein E8E12_011784 [Didymella heteroderae]